MAQLDEKKTNDNSLRDNRIRSGIYPMAGFFLLYQAYCIYNEISVTSGNKQILMIVFSILFSICGLAFILLGLSMMYKLSKKKNNQEEQVEE